MYSNMKFNLKDLINSARGRAVFSILLGLGLATLFRKACNNRNCLVFKAPSLNNIKDKIFGYNKKCYKYEEKGTTCSVSDNSDEDIANKLDNPKSGSNIILEMGE